MIPRHRRRWRGIARALALVVAGAGFAWSSSEALGALLGSQTRISVTGADGDATLDAFSPDVAYNPVTDQYPLSTSQLLINQRISQAAVRRANELIARIEDGLVGGDIGDGSLTGLYLAPEAFVP
jgi:hypothetical protein